MTIYVNKNEKKMNIGIPVFRWVIIEFQVSIDKKTSFFTFVS